MKGLNDAVRSNYNPRNFCSVFKNIDGSNIDVNEQMDADEFFNNLMDKLENELKKNNQEGIIPRTFGGKLVQEIISSECNHRSTVESKFLTLSIEVKSMTSIIQSLERMVTGEILEGENKYSCESCQKKVKARKRESISKLPNKLVFVLKRFDFRYETYTKSKLNSYCEFPEKIDMRKYSQQYLNEDQLSKPDSYFNFTLRGVTIHRGTAESGHYYSYIRGKHGRWFEFNDTNIRPFDTQNLPESAFGVENEGDSLWSRGTRVGNAYMLFYERDGLYDEEDNPISTLLDGLKLSANSMQSYTTEKIMNENFEYYLKRVFFDNTYFDFLIDKAIRVGIDQLHSPLNKPLMCLAFSTFLILLLRRKNKDKIPHMYKLLSSLLKSSREAACWLLQNASSSLFVQEFLVDCLIQDMKILVYGLLAQALQTLMARPAGQPLDESALELAVNFVRLLLKEAKRSDPAIPDREKFLNSVYRLINLCSRFPELCAALANYELPQALPYLFCFKDRQELELLDVDPSPPEFEGLFKGYQHLREKRTVTLEDKEWKRKGETKVKLDFKVDYSYLIAAAFRVVNSDLHRFEEVLAFLFDQRRWTSILERCSSTESQREICESFIRYAFLHPDLLPRAIEDLQKTFLEAKSETYKLRNATSFFRVFSRLAQGLGCDTSTVSLADADRPLLEGGPRSVRQGIDRKPRLPALDALPHDAQQPGLLRHHGRTGAGNHQAARARHGPVHEPLPRHLQKALQQPADFFESRVFFLGLDAAHRERVRATRQREQEAQAAPARARPPVAVPGLPGLDPPRLRRRVRPRRARPRVRHARRKEQEHLEAQSRPAEPRRPRAGGQLADRKREALDPRRRRKAGSTRHGDARVPIQNRWHLTLTNSLDRIRVNV